MKTHRAKEVKRHVTRHFVERDPRRITAKHFTYRKVLYIAAVVAVRGLQRKKKG